MKPAVRRAARPLACAVLLASLAAASHAADPTTIEQLKSGTDMVWMMAAGALVFFPSGVPTVRIKYAVEGDKSASITMKGAEVILVAKRV